MVVIIVQHVQWTTALNTPSKVHGWLRGIGLPSKAKLLQNIRVYNYMYMCIAYFEH